MIAIRALGPVELSLDGGPAPAPLLWRKHLALLVYLARSPRRTRTREHLMALLWGDKDESAARHSLREAIRVLRHAGGESVIETAGDAVRLADDAVTLDVASFERSIAAGDWQGASEIAVGDFLEGFGVPDAPGFEDWLGAERLAVRHQAINALVRRSEETQRRGDLAAAAECARRALALDATSNAAVRALMQALALHGMRAEALAAYEAAAARLREAVGTEPDEATRRLAEQVRRERIVVHAPRQSDGAESRRAPLVGRDAELERLGALWQAVRGGAGRVAVIGGPSGVGRSRLTAELAARARLDGGATTAVRGTAADREVPWSGVQGLARGGLLEAAGIAAAPPEALAAFAAIEEWGDRFPAARGAKPLAPGAAFTAVLRAAAVEQPVMVALDDANLLDGETLSWTQAAARDLAGAPALLVIAMTPEPARAELDALQGRIGRDLAGDVIRTEPLGPLALRALARWAMPTWTEIEVDRLARRIAADSAGLPLLAVELLHAVALGLDLHGTPRAWPEPERTMDQTLPGAVPETIVAAIRIGYRRLSKDAQLALAAAAVAETGADAAALGRATELEPERLAAALDEAEWDRWLAADGRGYQFVARVARDVIARDMLTEGQRQRLQARLAGPTRSPTGST
jgi:DNA-binding SARP family transcriptional activator